MIWLILVALAIVVLVGWIVSGRSLSGRHADKQMVIRTRGKDEGRGIGPTGY